ncbi:alpha-tocopherol transfer protein-like [Uloborus diversus]|uniref:alpha-tocopherol transfer protein-like n=1 Tax=Uloborus diversus TaxID=327109 RepID=UPI002409FB1F|nr:alpha-tocopherol transfer protein-like [Uloborus diversus]XP_054714300.1 alpha-tocopherol transfer protein-like [Uloborus diversus]
MTLLPAWMDGLTPEMVRKAEEELGETIETRLQALKDLRRLVHSESDFRPRLDDAFLIRFLRARKFNPQRAFNALRNYYTFKVRYSGMLTDFKPSEVQKVMEMNNLFVLPRRDPSGAVVGLLRAGYFNVEKASPNDLIAAVLVCAELCLEVEATQVCGAVLIVDFEKFSFKLMKQFASPALLYRIIRCVQDCVPCRIKAYHMVNEPFYFNYIFNIAKTLLSEKLKKRIHFHGSDLKSLHKLVPPDVLPQELGGTLGSMDNKEFRCQLLNRESHFEKINKYGFQEKKAQFIRKKSSRALGLFF